MITHRLRPLLTERLARHREGIDWLRLAGTTPPARRVGTLSFSNSPRRVHHASQETLGSKRGSEECLFALPLQPQVRRTMKPHIA